LLTVDANGLRFWSVTKSRDWAREGDPALEFDEACGCLRLPSARALAVPEDTSETSLANTLLAITPQAVDAFETYAFYDAAAHAILAAGAAPGSRGRHAFTPADQVVAVNDLTLGGDDLLYVALTLQAPAPGSPVRGAVRIVDTLGRFPAVTLERADFRAFRLASRAGQGVWLVDDERRQIWQVRGRPFPDAELFQFDGDIFRPVDENPDPPRLTLIATLPVGERPVAIASNSQGETLVLCWRGTNQAFVRRVYEDGTLSPRFVLEGVARPFSVGWLSSDEIAVLVAATSSRPVAAEPVPYRAPTTTASSDATLRPLGGLYPLANYANGPFAHAPSEPARYPTRGAGLPGKPSPLLRLSAPELARSGVARNAQVLDSQVPQCEWHRLYLDASVPAGTGVRVFVAASEVRTPPPDDQYFLHACGQVNQGKGVPTFVWTAQTSELPFHPGLVPCGSVPGEAGLFSVLIQRTGRAVSALRGRYLHVRVELVGNGKKTPEIFSLRAYASRFSYVREYLPRIYHEQLMPPDADGVTSRTTQADFFERFLATFESVLTPLEDRVANAHLLTNPATAPDEALEWLGGWIGATFDPAYPPERRRQALTHAMELFRTRGTMRGLRLALNILTGGAEERGQIVVVEDYRIRRTFATILGADLADEQDPLLAGLVASGNSIVGDTLFLGKEYQREFLSVFREVLPERPQGASIEEWISYIYERYIDPQVVDDFFDRLAHRLTVLVHQEVPDERLGLIARIVELEAPAHLETQVVRASYPFIVGLASLVGVDTVPRAAEPPPALTIDQSRIGERARLHRPASLDPSLEG
jgi:phage tail-like protein